MRVPRKRFTRRPPFGEALESRRLLSNLPFIAEFQAVNDATLADEDGDFSDWIEVRNPNDEDVDLSGWYLTDDQLKLTKWQFPAVRVPAKSELVIFASDKDRRISPGTLHTNFRLLCETRITRIQHQCPAAPRRQYRYVKTHIVVTRIETN